MASPSRLPHLLESYLCLPPRDSLILLTNILNASTNWLLLRFLLKPSSDRRATQHRDGDSSSSVPKIVLVSFLRDWEFWRDSGRRMGLDLGQLSRDGLFVFVDGLSELFRTVPSEEEVAWVTPGTNVLQGHGIPRIEKSVNTCLGSSTSQEISGKALLLLDGLDLLLAATPASSLETHNLVMRWRDQAHAMVITVAADQPLLQSPSTPLETEHAALVTDLAQQAYFVMSLRLLSTGVAKDISGVIRITRGPEAGEMEFEGRKVEDQELLYSIAGDSSVKVFERGSGDL